MDGYYFHQQNNDKRIKANEDQGFCFLWWHWKEPFWMGPNSRFKFFLDLFVRRRINCFFYKFLIYQAVDRGMPCFKITTVESRFLEPSFFEPLNNSKQKSFSCPQSNTVILPQIRTQIFQANFRFPWRFEKSGFHYNLNRSEK